MNKEILSSYDKFTVARHGDHLFITLGEYTHELTIDEALSLSHTIETFAFDYEEEE